MALLAGYTYAHLLSSKIPVKFQVFVHALLVLSAGSILMAAQLADKKAITLEVAKQMAAAAEKAAAANKWTMVIAILGHCPRAGSTSAK